MTKGIIYIATGNPYLNEARVSAETARNHNDANIGIIVPDDLKQTADEFGVFDDIIPVDKKDIHRDLTDKLDHMGKSPYDKSIYIDTDTYVLDDISPIFDTLDRFDITATHAPIRPIVTINGVPDAFPELNTGVVGFRSTDNINKFFSEWKNIHSRQVRKGRPDETVTRKGVDNLKNASSFGKAHGQPPFREALFNCNLQFSALPREYNFRGSGRAYGKVKILHMGHDRKGERLKKVINRNTRGRTYVDSKGELFIENGDSITISHKRIENIYSTAFVQAIMKKSGISKYAKRFYTKYFLD